MVQSKERHRKSGYARCWYNIGPTTHQPIIRQSKETNEQEKMGIRAVYARSRRLRRAMEPWDIPRHVDPAAGHQSPRGLIGTLMDRTWTYEADS